MTSSAFSIRPMRSSDEPFIFRAWLEGYWPHFPGRVVVSKSEFMQRWHRLIEAILADAKTRTVIAHVEGEPDVLLGFACFRGGVNLGSALHWAYTKQAFRRMGICRTMLESVECQTLLSHWPGRDRDGWAYAPELLKEYAL